MSVRHTTTAASFKKATKGFVTLSKTRERRLYALFVRSIQESIVEGSALTGAPGQPWKTGKLKNSWIRTGTIDQRNVAIISRVKYAYIIESNSRGATLRSSIGGFHSVAMTKANARLLAARDLAIIKAKGR